MPASLSGFVQVPTLIFVPPQAMSEEAEDKADSMSRVFADKAVLRKQMLRTLRQLSDAELEDQSRAVAQRVFESPYLRNARTVGCYLSMAKGELRTNAIIREVLSQNKALFVPYIPHELNAGGGGSSDTPDMRMLRIYSNDDLERCPLDKWGIIDPGLHRLDADGRPAREDCLEEGAPRLDLILVPGVAFDRDCNRLGRGKAYYDRFLQAYTTDKASPRLIALALSPQMLIDESVPVTDSDFRLDGVLHPGGLVERLKESR